VHAIRKDLFRDLLLQYAHPGLKPALGFFSGKTAPRQRQGCPVVKKMIPENMRFQVITEPLGLHKHTAPQSIFKIRAGLSFPLMISPEISQPILKPLGDRPRLPADSAFSEGMIFDPAGCRGRGILEIQGPDPFEIMQVVLPEPGQLHATPVRRPANLLVLVKKGERPVLDRSLISPSRGNRGSKWAGRFPTAARVNRNGFPGNFSRVFQPGFNPPDNLAFDLDRLEITDGVEQQIRIHSTGGAGFSGLKKPPSHRRPIQPPRKSPG